MADQAPDDVEAQAGALADRLGGEERLEHALADVGGNARPVVDDADDDALALAGRGHVDAARLRNGIERVVDQVRPDLIELAGEAANARQVGLARRPSRRRISLAPLTSSTATVLPRLDVRSTGSATAAWSMCVKPLMAVTSPEIRIAAS